MDEQILFYRIHGALDVEPRPGAYERLERALAASTIRTRSVRSFAGVRFTGGLKLLAAALAILLLVAAAGALIGLRLASPGPTPARQQLSVTAYQALIQQESVHWSSVGDSTTCIDLQSVCPAPGRPVQTALKLWLNDLGKIEPPARFAVVDSLLRVHIGAQIADLDEIFAAYAARDEIALTNWYYAGGQEASWISDVADTIVASRPVTAVRYVASVRLEQANLAACDACSSFAGSAPLSCIDPRALCKFDAFDARGVIEVFEATVVKNAAPAGLSGLDAQLQGDLASADRDLENIATAILTANQAGLDASRPSLAGALRRVGADITRILSSK